MRCARSSIARGRVWQAEYMISGVRDRVLALACVRHGLPAIEGRGIDSLPPDVTRAIAGALVGALDAAELRRALHVVTDALLAEINHVDAGLADRLAAAAPRSDRRVRPDFAALTRGPISGSTF